MSGGFRDPVTSGGRIRASAPGVRAEGEHVRQVAGRAVKECERFASCAFLRGEGRGKEAGAGGAPWWRVEGYVDERILWTMNHQTQKPDR